MIEKWAQKGTTRARKTLGSLSKDVVVFRIWNKWRNPTRGFNAEKSLLWFPAFFPFWGESRKGFKNCSQEQRFCTRTKKKSHCLWEQFCKPFWGFAHKTVKKEIHEIRFILFKWNAPYFSFGKDFSALKYVFGFPFNCMVKPGIRVSKSESIQSRFPNRTHP